MALIFCRPNIAVKEISLGSGETFKIKYSDTIYAEFIRSTENPNIIALKLPNKNSSFGYLFINDTLNGVVVRDSLDKVS
jgi:hypothetical protein